MEPPSTTVHWTCSGASAMKWVVVAAVFLVGYLAGGLTLSIAIGTGVAVSVFSANRTTRREDSNRPEKHRRGRG